VKDLTIVHISDLHLGHDFLWRSAKELRAFWKTEDAKLIAALGDALRDLHPDYVVISGDIVNKSTRRNFTHAASVLKRLFAAAGIDARERVLVVPGNHDAPPLRKYRNNPFGRMKHFVTFLKEVFDESDILRRKPRFVHLDTDRGVCFIGLDSTLKDRVQLAEGEIGPRQRAWFESKLARLEKGLTGFDNYVKIAIVHHHPEPIEHAADSERFMQLLDAAETRGLFQKARVNLVLHGHKHYPHSTPIYHDGHSYTVVGAGTCLCPLPREDAGTGNNFNVIRVRPSVNMVEVRRHTASPDKRFLPSNEVRQHPLFPKSETGYRIRTCEMTTRILDLDGRCIDSNRRFGVVIDGSRQALQQTAFQWASESAVAEIVDFECDDEVIKEVTYDAGYDDRNPRVRRGKLVLRDPLQWGTEPVDVWWTFEAKGAFCMRRDDIPKFYPSQHVTTEDVSAVIAHHVDILRLTVEFPRKFWVPVAVSCLDGDAQIVPIKERDYVLQSDKVAGRYTLFVRAPKLHHSYVLSWRIP
jgi:3',5'-cyclic AMP phosphodiesterase CpdA